MPRLRPLPGPPADWRNPQDYSQLSGIDRAGLMWEFLRRDPDYIAWYARASTATRGGRAAETGTWGLHLREDPRRAAPDARLIWSADLDPYTLHVVALPGDRASPDSFDPGAFGGWLAIARDPDGHEHVVLSDGYNRIRIEVDEGSIATGQPVLLEYRLIGLPSAASKVLSLRRFLELCRTGRFAASLFPPDRRLGRWLTVLRVHDALRAGASQREIACALYGDDRVVVDWRGGSDSLRSQVRRLVRDARTLAAGGYRQLLLGTIESDRRRWRVWGGRRDSDRRPH